MIYGNNRIRKCCLKKNNGCNAVYVGETGRTTKQRKGEHRKAVDKKDERSHIFKHYRETGGHSFNFEDEQVLAAEKLEHPKNFLEEIYTKFDKNTFNSFKPVF